MITFTPVKKDNNWVIEQTMIVGTFSSEDECRQACEALKYNYSMKDWEEDFLFKQKLKDIPKELFFKTPKPTKKVIKIYADMQESVFKNKDVSNDSIVDFD